MFWLKNPCILFKKIFVGYSGSDLSNIATSAMMRPIEEVINCREWLIGSDGKMSPFTRQAYLLGLEPIRCGWRELPEGIIQSRHVNVNDVFNAFHQIKLTVSDELREKYITYSE